ncbi:MAG: Glu/Leu/Phe/Val dehydrogenase dimerization domain-containing protein [Actinomycetota bacterium]|nr:Glu/Leu/Phe/Val dehydrogenase dimerization domain-containing protein [Actinomycetota bacterium]
MGVFEAIGTESHEEVLYGVDHDSGLRTIIAIHSTALGPALGGTRFFPYADETAALRDVLRLSKGMTLKSAAAGLDLGGGKAVIIGDPATLKSESLVRAYGRVIDTLGGRYVTAADVGTTTDDMVLIAEETPWVSGLPFSHGGSGDPSPATARGVMASFRAIGERLWGSDILSGRRIAVQGIGKVGMDLVRLLTEAGAETIVTDLDPEAMAYAVETYGSKAVGLNDIYDVDCDVFSPCALGATLNEGTVPRLRCSAIAGSANNQLAVDTDIERIVERGILYAPDFVVNAGGVINIAVETDGYSAERAGMMVDRIYDNLVAVFETADSDGVNPEVAALGVAQQRIDQAGGLRFRRRPIGE